MTAPRAELGGNVSVSTGHGRLAVRDRPILVVSNDETNALVVALLLGRRGYDVVRTTPCEAGEKIKAVRPAVVFYDPPAASDMTQDTTLPAIEALSGGPQPFQHMILLGAQHCRAPMQGDAIAPPALAVLQKPFNVDAAEKILSFLLSTDQDRLN